MRGDAEVWVRGQCEDKAGGGESVRCVWVCEVGGGGVRGRRGEKAGVQRGVSGVRWLRGKVRRV